jgi:hypothetical protein
MRGSLWLGTTSVARWPAGSCSFTWKTTTGGLMKNIEGSLSLKRSTSYGGSLNLIRHYVLPSNVSTGKNLQVDPTRSTDQNSAQWPILEAFSKQLKWPVNGRMVYMTSEDWKDVLTAAFRRESVRIANGLDHGVVMLGIKTSKMKKAEFSEWLEFLKATAAMRGVDIAEQE